MAAPTGYQRLPGGKRVTSSLIRAALCSLWLGEDHLLSIVGEGFSETYKRFYLKDIQAIVLRRTPANTINMGILALPAAVCTLLLLTGAARGWFIGVTIGLAVMAALFSLLLLIEAMRGATCIAYIRTAVQTDRLHTLTRLRQARKLVAHLAPAIQAAQGTALPENAAELYAAASASRTSHAHTHGPGTMVRQARRPDSGRLRPLKPYRGQAHLLLFMILLIDVCHSCVRFFAGGTALLVMGIAVGIALLVVLALALWRQHATDLNLAVKLISWVVVGYVIFGHLLAMLHSVVYMITNHDMTAGSWQMMMDVYSKPAWGSPMAMVELVYALLGSGTLGFAGLITLNRFYKARGAAPELTAPGPLPPIPPRTETAPHGEADDDA